MSEDQTLEKLKQLENEKEILIKDLLNELSKEYNQLTQRRTFPVNINISFNETLPIEWIGEDQCVIIHKDESELRANLINQIDDIIAGFYDNSEEIKTYNKQIVEFIDKCCNYADLFNDLRFLVHNL